MYGVYIDNKTIIKENIVLNFTNSFRIIAIILVCLIVISTFTYGKKEKIDYNLMFDASTKSFRKKQIIGTIIIGALVAGVCFLIYYFVFMNK